MFGLLRKKGAAAREAAEKMGKKDLVEAICAACVLVSAADGDIEESELAAMQSIIENHDAVALFRGEIPGILDKYKKKIMVNGKVSISGKVALMREIADVKADAKEKEDVFAVAVDIAGADGEIEPAEKTVLKDIANKLNINTADYGI
jgi:tellurite resistance protein TerB